MPRRLVLLFLLGLCVLAHAQQVKPYLRIETGVHTSNVRRIDVDADDERFLVSASYDKTARVWDLQSGRLLKILRPPIGDKEILCAVAISPNGESVAVGGQTVADPSGNYPVYIFDRESGRLRKGIPAIPTTTLHLAYSKDGRYLAVALYGKNGIRIYETASYSEVARDTDYGDDSYWLDFDRSGKLVTTSLDGFVRLYSPDFHLPPRKEPSGGRWPFSVRFSSDGNLIALGFADSTAVKVLSASNLSFRYQPATPTDGRNLDLSKVTWSADSRTLCAAGTYNINSARAVLCWGDAGRGKLSTFPVAGETIMNLQALRDGGIAFAVTDGTVGVLAPSGESRWRAAPKILDYGGSLLRVSSDGNRVEVNGFDFSGTGRTSHNLRFSVQERNLETDPKPDASLSSPVTSGIAVTDWQSDFAPKLDGHALRGLEPRERSRSLAIAPNQDSFVLGADWNIYRFDRQGTQIWNTRASDTVWCVNVTADRRFVVAALGDGTIRWYTFDKGDEVLAVFVDRDLKRWVIWNPDGFFTFDGDGDALIGYQINGGPEQAGDFVKVDQLREVFYRPDLISQILRPGGAEALLAARNRVGDISKVLSSGLPPEIEVISSTPQGADGEYLIEYRIKDMGGGKGDIVCRIDGQLSDCGVPLQGREYDIAGTAGDTIVRSIVRVPPGEHNFATAGTNAARTVEGTPKTIQLKGRAVTVGSNLSSLYVVAAGVSEYSNPKLKEGVKFAADDADLIAAKFQQQEGKGLYQKVTAVSLRDSNATGKSIRDALAIAANAVQPGNTFVLYLAGHGIAVDGEYYFIPWAEKYADQKDLVANSLSREAIYNLLKQVHTKTNRIVLVLDTCGSGAFLGDADVDKEQGAMQRLGGISGYTVFAASNKVAMEGYQNHGVLTYVLIEAMTKATGDPQGDISIGELGMYAMDHVPKITKQRWNYEQNPIILYASGQFPIVHKVTN